MDNAGRDGASKCFSLDELAKMSGARIKGDSRLKIRGITSLEEAGSDQLSFVVDERYREMALQCKAGALIVPPSMEDLDRTLLLCEQPYLAMARVAQLFAEPPQLSPGVHRSAYVGDGVLLGEGVRVGPLVHIGDGCRIGDGTRIYGGAYLGNNVEIGEDCLIYPNVSILDRCILGSNVIIHSGTVVGSDGFGFAHDSQGRHVKIPQVGIVQIEDDVEIGANCAIDRGTFGRTWIRKGAKIDNLVQIAHNVVIGEYSIVIAQVGISGSTKVGKHVILAGQVGVVGHIEIGDGARVGAQSGVSHRVKPGEDVLGSPAMPYKDFRKMVAHMKRLPQTREELKELQKKVQKLEEVLLGSDHGK